MNLSSRAEDFQMLVITLNDFRFFELLSAAVGTFIGAYFAYQFSKSEGREQSLVREDSALSQAIQLATSYLDPAINLKTQFNLPKHNELKSLQAAYKGFIENGEVSSQPVLIKHLWTLFAPIDFSMLRIVEAVRNLSSVAGRPMTCAIHLEREATNLSIMFEQYNRIAQELQVMPRNNPNTIKLILGEAISDTLVDKRFYQSIVEISAITDRMIFLAYLLANDLSAHQKTWRYRVKLKRRKSIVWQLREENLSLLPDSNLFSTLLELPVVALE